LRIAFLLGLLGASLACSRTAPAPAPTRPTSLLLVTIDTLRADRLGAYGDAQARTPALDLMASQGVLFERAYSVAPLTLPTHATVMTGLLPPQHGVRGNVGFALDSSRKTLAEVLQNPGRKTAAFIGGFPLSRQFGLARGFDHYDDALPRAPGIHFDFAERPASAVVAAARAWVASRSGPLFVWVHLFDPHAPYAPPAAHAQADAYRGEVAAVDAALAPLLAEWGARPDALTVVTADHGEAFGEHREESHSLFVYDTTLHVPLLVRGPGLTPATRIARPVSLVDLAGTVLYQMGVYRALPGTPLLHSPSLQQAAPGLYAETLAPRLDFGWSDLRSFREGGLKYIRAPRPELYDLAADPGEARNLAEARPADVARLERGLSAALSASGETESRRAPDPEAAERLRALGYVQGLGARGSGADPKDKVEVARRIAAAVGPFRDHHEAARTYAEIAALDPENPLVLFRLADALLRAGRAREAVAPFRLVVARNPRTADPFVGLATALAQLERLDEAEAVLRQALVVAPADGQAHYNLGEIARVRGDHAAARAAYEQALADPVTHERAQARLREAR
jgi:choline-sulfatase